MAAILFATGIMSESGMLKAMAQGAVQHLPSGLGRHPPVLLRLLSMPLIFLLGPTFLLTGLCDIEMGEHQRFTVPWLFAAWLLMVLAYRYDSNIQIASQ